MGGLRFLQRTLSHHPPFRWAAFRVLMVKIEGQARVARGGNATTEFRFVARGYSGLAARGACAAEGDAGDRVSSGYFAQ
jgi:hypothetical protein